MKKLFIIQFALVGISLIILLAVVFLQSGSHVEVPTPIELDLGDGSRKEVLAEGAPPAEEEAGVSPETIRSARPAESAPPRRLVGEAVTTPVPPSEAERRVEPELPARLESTPAPPPDAGVIPGLTIQTTTTGRPLAVPRDETLTR